LFSGSACLLALACTLLACAESQREQATGKGVIRGVNGLIEPLDVNFLIEERSLGVLNYKAGSASQAFDDLSYIFNFNIAIAGQAGSQRIASVPQKITADHDYVFIVAGRLASPDTFAWERPERIWAGDETTFDMAFAHFDITLGRVDIYYDLEGIAPMVGNQIGTIDYGERIDEIEFESDSYELIITAANTPLDIKYAGIPFTPPSAQSLVTMIFQADPSITGEHSVRQMLQTGDTFEIPDARFLPTVQLVNASLETGNVDLTVDNDFANPPAISDQPFGEVSTDADVLAGTNPFTYTLPGDTTPLLEVDTPIASGRRATILLYGDLSTLATAVFPSDRRSIATEARIRITNGSFNHQSVDLYLTAPDILIDDIFPFTRLPLGISTGYLSRAAGLYDLTIAAEGEKTILAGPIELDVENGDIVELFIIDNVDTAIVDVLIYSNLP
jgi:hypothetical protein